MSEQALGQSAESQAVSSIEDRLRPDYVDTRVKELSERLTSVDDLVMRRVHAGLVSAEIMMVSAIGTNALDYSPVLEGHARNQGERIQKMFGPAAVRERGRIVSALSQIERAQESGSTPKLQYWGEEGVSLLEGFRATPETSLQVADTALEPEYVRGSDDSKLKERLASQPFVSTETINDAVDPTVSQLEIYLTDGFDVPTERVVSAERMESWLGRGNDGSGNKSAGEEGIVTSFDKIIHNAGRNTPIPSVEVMTMYVQPDGQTFYGLAGDGAHRTAAAILRGEPTVQVYGNIKVVGLRENVLSFSENHIADDISSVPTEADLTIGRLRDDH